MGSFFSAISTAISVIKMAMELFKAAVNFWKQMKYNERKDAFQEGTVERDQTKVEEGFGSGKAGKPSGHGRIVDE